MIISLTPENRDDIIAYRLKKAHDTFMRQSGDYDDLFDWGEEDVVPIIPQVEGFIQRIRELLDS